MERWRRYAGPVLGVVLFGLALLVLRHELEQYHYRDITAALAALPTRAFLLAGLLAALDYLLLAGSDALALAYVRHPLSAGRVIFASFAGNALSHNVGFALLSGGSVRLRLYSGWGLSASEITEVVGFAALTTWLGFLALAGVSFLAAPPPLPAQLGLPGAFTRLLGLACLGALALYAAWGARSGRPLQLGGVAVRRPGAPMAAAQVGLSAVDWAVAAWVFHALLPPAAGVGFGLVLGAFLLAQVAGVASQIPGGLGVFETVALWLLTPALPAASVLGSLLAFRAIYYVAPLFLATALLGAYELLQRRGVLVRLGAAVGRLSPAIVAPLMAFATFAGGAILLFSGATPGVEDRLRGLERLVPLAVIEGSHFVGSLIGATLLLLAQGLARRLDAAWHLAVLLLGAGIVASLLKGWDYEEAALLAILLLALLPCRRYFRRRSALLAERFSPRWIAAIGLVLAAALWLALFAHEHVELDRNLWWQVSLFGDAPRALRAAVGSVSLLLFFAVARLLRPAAPGPVTELVGRERDTVRAVVAASPSTAASLALLGDKSILLASSGRAFIMYGTQGRAWIALGDPVGPREEWAPLAWRLREESDLHGGWPAFYQASAAGLPIYVDLGLSLLKLGEEARVPLPGFSISGDEGKKFRHLRNKLEREGCRVERIEREDVPALLPELRAVSDAWLVEKSTREKRFSIGCFEEDYLREFPAVVVRREGRVLAFANLLLSAEREEVSVDLMRHVPEAPHGVMDFLLLELMLRGREEGYQYFNLGMAPLAGLQDRQLAPLWNRFGALVFRHGEHFYNFQGVRAYKEKFNPVWEPRYLASPSGLAVPRILAAVSSLIGGGLKGVVAK